MGLKIVIFKITDFYKFDSIPVTTFNVFVLAMPDNIAFGLYKI